MTRSADIRVNFVNQPDRNPKFGSIKIDPPIGESSYVSVPKNMLGLFSVGQRCTILYSSREYNGKTYYTVDSVKSTANGAAAAPGGGRYGVTDDATAERIFVAGALNAAIRNGGLVPGDERGITEFVTRMRRVWANTFGNKGGTTSETSRPAPRDDMDDDIPF